VSPEFHPSSCLRALERLLPAAASGRVIVAFSGGLDSTVLLHALVAAGRDRPGLVVSAVHIDHQLHPDSRQWSDHCAEVACALGVEYLSEQVLVDGALAGIEAAAREARYRALKSIMRDGDCVLTAHHADDQLETVLLALMRGAGVTGLAGMPGCQPFGSGWHVRPLLEFTRARLHAWAQAQGLSWLSDPSNEGRRFDRNYLRHEVIPALTRRWPAASAAAVRSAAHLAEAGAILGEIGAADVASSSIGECLRVERLAALPAERRRNALRVWLKARGARMPSTRKLQALEHDMIAAQEDRSPCVAWDGFEVRRHRGLLYAGAVRERAPDTTLLWDSRAPLELPSGLGRLRAEPAHGSGFSAPKWPQQIEVRFRSGGEQLRLAGREHHHKVKKLLQSAGVLPWWRDRIPMLYVQGELVAVGDLWIAEAYAARESEPAVRLVWEGKPEVLAPTADRQPLFSSSAFR
jgi:tRNA(Ile)-lysidine synthase